MIKRRPPIIPQTIPSLITTKEKPHDRFEAQTMIAAGNTLDDGRVFAAKLSNDHPGKYITLYAAFGLYALVTDRLHVHAPSDSIGHSYWLNGTENPFTDSQHGADQRATPALS